VRAEPQHLLAAKVRHAQWMSVRGEPHGLHHVPEVEASRLERPVPEHRERAEAGGERSDSEPDG
jgi:hypothetical protein